MHDILDLDRYPLDRLDSPEARALVARCQADLAADGMFNLDGLLKPGALAGAVAEVKPVLDSASFTHRQAVLLFTHTSGPAVSRLYLMWLLRAACSSP